MVQLQDSFVSSKQGVVCVRGPHCYTRAPGRTDGRVPCNLQTVSKQTQEKDQGFHSGSKSML
jgi:hypothetical protein